MRPKTRESATAKLLESCRRFKARRTLLEEYPVTKSAANVAFGERATQPECAQLRAGFYLSKRYEGHLSWPANQSHQGYDVATHSHEKDTDVANHSHEKDTDAANHSHEKDMDVAACGYVVRACNQGGVRLYLRWRVFKILVLRA
jgi:hypothetical protein